MCSSAYHLAPLGFYRDCVAAEMESAAASGAQIAADCRFADIHIASSCLQKALRRGEAKFALAAARQLLRDDPERLWRRLCVCAFEDFGLADLTVTARVVVIAADRSFRLVRGEERVLSHLINLLCTVPKDRRLDDLYALGAAAFADRQRLETIRSARLGTIVAPLVHQTSRLMASCERAVPRRASRVVSNEACVLALSRMAGEGLLEGGLFELCAKGVRLSRCLLPMLLPLAIEATEAAGGRGEAESQALPPVPTIFGVPAYAIDGFTRMGRSVLSRLLVAEPSLKKAMSYLPAAARLDVVRHILFVVEGSLCTSLICDPLADALRSESVACARGLSRDEVTTAVALMQRLLPAVHRLRAEIMSLTTPKEPLS